MEGFSQRGTGTETRCCARCEQDKPLTGFSIAKQLNGKVWLHSYCKVCRNEQAAQRAALGRRKGRKVNRTEIWPRKFSEALLDVSAKRWRYPVERAQLRWAA